MHAHIQKGNEMTTAKRTTMTIRMDRKMRLERIAIDVSKRINEQVTWTDLVNTLIDEFSKDAQELIIHRKEQEKK